MADVYKRQVMSTAQKLYEGVQIGDEVIGLITVSYTHLVQK